MDETRELQKLTDREAVAYWNILQFSTRTLNVDTDGTTARHTAIMDAILTERGIAHEHGKLTNRRAA